MNLENSINEIKKISKHMFINGLFSMFHGSISMKIADNQFIINKKNTIFGDLQDDDLSILSPKKDYRWNEASIDSDIHLNIYQNIIEAKCVCYAMPPYLTAYSLNHVNLEPKDYFSSIKFDNIFIYDIKQFDDWYERAPFEVSRHMQTQNTNILIIKGYGIYAYERNILELARTIALLENSCKLLQLDNKF